MLFTVRATIEEVTNVAYRNDCDCDLWETDHDDLTLVRMSRDVMLRFVHIINRMGIAWHVGKPRHRYADPTFATAAQAFSNPDRIVRR